MSLSLLSTTDLGDMKQKAAVMDFIKQSKINGQHISSSSNSVTQEELEKKHLTDSQICVLVKCFSQRNIINMLKNFSDHYASITHSKARAVEINVRKHTKSEMGRI